MIFQKNSLYKRWEVLQPFRSFKFQLCPAGVASMQGGIVKAWNMKNMKSVKA
jgi:hypothetical protein